MGSAPVSDTGSHDELLSLCGAAGDAVDRLVAAARGHLRGRVVRGDRLVAAELDARQFAVDGLAWDAY